MPEREGKDKAVLLTVLPRRKVVIIRNVHGLYSTRETHDKRGVVKAVKQTNSNCGGGAVPWIHVLTNSN